MYNRVSLVWLCFTLTRHLPNGSVLTAIGVQEMLLNTQTKHCSAKNEK